MMENRMLLSAFAAIAMFAAPETPTSGAAASEPAAPAAAAQPAMRKVCTQMELPGTKLPKKKCKMVPVKAEEKVADQSTAKTEAAKPE
jgi:hypothetical protein